MKKQLLFFLFFIAPCCMAQEMVFPKGYAILQELKGDLDKDSIAEWVYILNTTDSTEDGCLREIQIFKQNHNQWTLWKKSNNALLKSKEGGMMADPYKETQIKNGILSISHYGGNSWQWSYTDKYRFQNNEFQLIGYSGSYGKICEYWVALDCNLSTGKMVYKKEYETCDEDDGEATLSTAETETFVKKGILLNLDNRHSKEIKIVTPKYLHEFYF